MRLTILGSTGRTGRHLLAQALDSGHTVTVLVRNPSRLSLTHEQLEVISGDACDLAAVETAVRGSDAVLSTLGPHRGSEPVCGPATANLVKAMPATGVTRVLVTSSTAVPRHAAGDRLLYRLTVKRILRVVYKDVYADLAAMESHLRNSDLDWTIIRPPRLTDKPGAGRYRTTMGGNVAGRYSIPRADLATGLLRLLDDPDTIRMAVGIAR